MHKTTRKKIVKKIVNNPKKKKPSNADEERSPDCYEQEEAEQEMSRAKKNRSIDENRAISRIVTIY